MHKIKIGLKLFNELTAAGTVLDFHQIPFSNKANIRKEPLTYIQITIFQHILIIESMKIIINQLYVCSNIFISYCHKVLKHQWHNNRILYTAINTQYYDFF